MENKIIKEKLIAISNALNNIPVKGQDVYTMTAIFNEMQTVLKEIDKLNDKEGE